HKVLVVLADLEGEDRQVRRAVVEPGSGRAERLAVARAALTRCLDESGVAPSRLRAIGAGTPGVVQDGVVPLCTVLPDRDDLAAVFAAARSGDARATAAVADFTDDLATGTAALLLAVDPAVVVVGGGLSRAGDLIVGGLRERLAALRPPPPEIRISALG